MTQIFIRNFHRFQYVHIDISIIDLNIANYHLNYQLIITYSLHINQESLARLQEQKRYAKEHLNLEDRKCIMDLHRSFDQDDQHERSINVPYDLITMVKSIYEHISEKDECMPKTLPYSLNIGETVPFLQINKLQTIIPHQKVMNLLNIPSYLPQLELSSPNSFPIGVQFTQILQFGICIELIKKKTKE